MLARCDVLLRHKQVDSVLIHFVRNQFVPSCVNFLFPVTRWDGVRVMSH